MPVYEYKGVDAAGKNTSGIVNADNERAGRSKLRKQGIFTTDIYLEGSKGFSLSGDFQINFGAKVKTNELAHMTRQLATLLEAKIPLVDSLAALQDQVENVFLKKSLSQIKDKVVEGGRLADALRSYPDIYDDLYVYMVQAGEASGALEQVLNRLADFTEYQAVLKSKISGALMYPIIMALVGTGLMVFLLVSVVPNIVTIFEDAEATLPLPTQIVIFASDTIQNYWYLLLIAAFFASVFYKKYAKSTKGRMRLDKLSLKIPIFGQLFRKIAISRFSRTLGTLLKSGVQLLPALDIVKNVVGNKVLTEAIDSTKDSVREGESIAEPLKRSGEFPSMVVHMISVGEKTGALEPMLEKVAGTYDMEVDTTVGKLTTLLEPLMILVMGGVVGLIVVAILLPILQMTNF